MQDKMTTAEENQNSGFYLDFSKSDPCFEVVSSAVVKYEIDYDLINVLSVTAMRNRSVVTTTIVILYSHCEYKITNVGYSSIQFDFEKRD